MTVRDHLTNFSGHSEVALTIFSISAFVVIKFKGKTIFSLSVLGYYYICGICE